MPIVSHAGLLGAFSGVNRGDHRSALLSLKIQIKQESDVGDGKEVGEGVEGHGGEVGGVKGGTYD